MTNDASGSTDATKRSHATRGAGWLLAGSAVGGVGAYAFQLLGTRSLGSEAYAPISVLWTILYLLVSVPLFALETATVRGTALQQVSSPWRTMAGVAGVGVAAGVATAAFGQELLGSTALVYPAVLTLSVVAYGVFAVVRGRLAGLRRSRAYGLLTGAESVVRIAAALLLLSLVAEEPEWLALALPVGPAVAALWWTHARTAAHRTSSTAESVPPPSVALQPMLRPMLVVNGVSQTLLAGGPLALALLGAPAEAISTLFITSTFARAPLVFLFGGLLSRLTELLAALALQRRTADIATLSRRILLAGTSAAVLVGAVAWICGPAFISALFGADFRPSRWLVTGYGGGVVLAATALALTQVLLALGDLPRLLLSWVTGGVLAMGVLLLLRMDDVVAVTTAFVVGEAIILGLLVLGCRAALRDFVPV